MKNNFLIIFLGLNLFLSLDVCVAQQKSTKKLVSKKTCCTTAIPNRLGIINSSSSSALKSIKITDDKNHEGMVWIPGGILVWAGIMTRHVRMNFLNTK